MESPVVFVLILTTVAFSDHVRSQSISASQNPVPVGSSVTLSSTAQVTLGTWIFDNNVIVFVAPGRQVIADSWSDKVTYNSSTSSLTLRSLTLDDSGIYTLDDLNVFRAQLTLSVQVPISNVTLWAKETNLVEYKDAAVLMCSVSNGSSLSFEWMDGNSTVTAGGQVLLSNGNATLTILNVTHHYQGPFRCKVSNGLSHGISGPVYLNINYGPEMPIITGPTGVTPGDSATLSCYAPSNPPSHYKWYFNGSLVSNTSEYITPHLPKGADRKYICKAFNNVTGQNSSAYIMLAVEEPIENVQIEAPDNPTTEGYSYNLTCNVTGPVDHVYWMKNGEPLHEDNTTVFSMNNKTVSFIPLNHYDTGYYQCMAANAVGNMTSPPHMLLVNYGPETPIIQGPAFAETGGYAVFNCSAMSVPPSHFSWWYNGSMVANTSVFTAGPLSLNMTGEYTCVAYNNVTEKNSSKSAMLTVIDGIYSVMIQASTIPIQNENFTLICDVVGPYDTIYWMQDNMKLNMTNPLSSYHFEKNMLHFTPVTVWNGYGEYQCVATNQAAQVKSAPYTLLVNFGPEFVMISGPLSAELGTPAVSLTCSAESRPVCNFYWFFSNQSNPLTNGSVVTFSATKENEGMYICKARNPVTNITMYQSQMFFVTAHASAIHFSSHGSLMLMGLFAFSTSVLFN